MIWKLALLGFGNVGRGLARLLVEKRQDLKRKYDFEYQVVGIYDINMGGVCVPDGEVDLEKLLEIVDGGGMISDYPGGGDDLNALGLIEKCNADVLTEMTYTDLETGEPAVSHCQQALAGGMHVVTSNKGPAALARKELWKLATDHGVQFRFEAVSKGLDPRLLLIEMSGRQLAGLSEGHDTGHVMGAAPTAPLLMAAEHEGSEAASATDVQGADTLGRVELVSRQGE